MSGFGNTPGIPEDSPQIQVKIGEYGRIMALQFP